MDLRQFAAEQQLPKITRKESRAIKRALKSKLGPRAEVGTCTKVRDDGTLDIRFSDEALDIVLDVLSKSRRT